MTIADNVSIEQRLGYLWIALPDTINMDNYKKVESEIDAHITGDSSHDRIVLDFCNTKSLYSSGIGMMIRLRRRLGDQKGFICCVNVSKKIRELLETVRLDMLFPIYATDVEFEISQDDVWEQKKMGQNIDFLCVVQTENGIGRINLSGQMKSENDLSPIENLEINKNSVGYIFDLTGLEVIDHRGVEALMSAIARVKLSQGMCVAYGAHEGVRDFLNIMALDEHCRLLDNERQALECVGRVP